METDLNGLSTGTAVVTFAKTEQGLYGAIISARSAVDILDKKELGGQCICAELLPISNDRGR